jgi:hypothetical protein
VPDKPLRYLHYHTCGGDVLDEVRHIFHRLRQQSIENFNEQFKTIFDIHEQVPTRGHVSTTRFALGADFVYQYALFYRFEQ